MGMVLRDNQRCQSALWNSWVQRNRKLGGTSGKEPTCQYRRCKRHRFDPWVKKIPWKRARQPTPVFLPGEFQGQMSLVGYHPSGRRVQEDWSDLARACTAVKDILLLALSPRWLQRCLPHSSTCIPPECVFPSLNKTLPTSLKANNALQDKIELYLAKKEKV